MTQTCYALVADYVSRHDWVLFERSLPEGFCGIPASWALPPGPAARLVLKLQWDYFNPDQHGDFAAKRAVSWAFLRAFIDEAAQRKFFFLRSRLELSAQERWDKRFAEFEMLLQFNAMDEALRLDWLSQQDAVVRYGKSRRVKVIKNKGVGLSSEVLGVTPLMTWPEIKARYRFLLKCHHPDVGGDPETTQAIIAAFSALQQKHEAEQARGT